MIFQQEIKKPTPNLSCQKEKILSEDYPDIESTLECISYPPTTFLPSRSRNKEFDLSSESRCRRSSRSSPFARQKELFYRMMSFREAPREKQVSMTLTFSMPSSAFITRRHGGTAARMRECVCICAARRERDLISLVALPSTK